ncbi:MAG TPA: TPM domain-containing protein [Candidatus Paceibacterota bacterium]|nr:TPM domain-containing protein [Candidatus Paceibacterota bacterium]
MKKNLFFLSLLVLVGMNIHAQGYLDSNGVPKPRNSYINDFTGKTLSVGEVQTLNHTLAQYEDSTSTQIVVIILSELPKMENGETWVLADLANETARQWGIGQKDKNNGVLMFFSMKEHKVRIQVGYGLEGAIPDVTAKRIIDETIVPAFKENNYFKGISEGIIQLQRVAAGEFKSEPEEKNSSKKEFITFLLTFFGLFVVVIAFMLFNIENDNKRHEKASSHSDENDSDIIPLVAGVAAGSTLSSEDNSGKESNDNDDENDEHALNTSPDDSNPNSTFGDFYSGGGGGFGGAGAEGSW